MRTDTVLIIERKDLFEWSLDKDFEDIEYIDIKGSYGPLCVNGVVMFVDKDGKTKLLKNRYGNAGLVQKKNRYSDEMFK